MLLPPTQRNKMVVLAVVVTVRLEEQLYLDKEIMLALPLHSTQILLLAAEVLVLLAERQLELCLAVVDLVRQVQLVDLQLLMQAEEEEVAFLVLPLEQEDLVEEATDRIVLLVAQELQIQEEVVEARGI
ncbi:MAG: hypothetical protein EBR82_88205 [Caulobacteraceae bacterium]|nr:hypothetical protein [Caulobacteraceae bacterium]